MKSAGLLLAVCTLAFACPAGAALQTFTATLDGLSEVPPNASPATGNATVIVDTNTNTLTVDLSFSGLVAAQTAAHIHGPAPAGVNAGVLHPLPLGSFTGHVIASNATVVGHIQNGLTYINVHSQAFPGGEIRGQLLPGTVSVEPNAWGAVKALYR